MSDIQIKNYMGERIKQKRKEYGYTMEELGAKLGVNKTAVNKWEKGYVTNIKQSTIKKLAEIFQVSPIWIMGYDDINEIGHISAGPDIDAPYKMECIPGTNRVYRKSNSIKNSAPKSSPKARDKQLDAVLLTDISESVHSRTDASKAIMELETQQVISKLKMDELQRVKEYALFILSQRKGDD